MAVHSVILRMLYLLSIHQGIDKTYLAEEAEMENTEEEDDFSFDDLSLDDL